MAVHVLIEYLQLRSVLIGIGIFLIVFWWLRRPGERCQNLPPGPSGWPIVGYLLHLGISLYRTGAEPFELFAQLSHTYGKVYSMFLGSQRVVILNGHECIKEAFQNPLLNDRPMITTSAEVNKGVLMVNGKLWQRQRRFTISTFRDFGIGKSTFEDQIAEEVYMLSNELIAQIDKPLDPNQLLSNAISNVICSVVFGKRFQYNDKDFILLLDTINSSVKLANSVSVFFPIIKLLDVNTNRTLAVITRILHEALTKMITAHKDNFDPDNVNDYVDAYLRELQQGGSFQTEDLDERSLEKTVLQLFIAGTDSTATTLRWALLYMMKYPDIQSRIQREIDVVVGRGRLPQMTDTLPFTEATLMEVQRIASVVPLGIPHCAAEDATFQGYSIPKGTFLMANIWAVHHDPELWSDPEEFRPERFLNEEGEVFQPEYYMPFNKGRRMCLGLNLARMELFIFFTHLLHRFTVSKPQNSPPLALKGCMGVTHHPQPFEIRLIERD